MYYILMDTNFLYISYDKFNSSFEHFEFNNAFQELRKAIKDAGEESNCELLVPELVVEELLKQRTSAYLSPTTMPPRRCRLPTAPTCFTRAASSSRERRPSLPKTRWCASATSAAISSTARRSSTDCRLIH